MTHLIAAYTPMQNGTVERAYRTIGDAVRAMLTGGGMEFKHWVEAACSFGESRNAMPRKLESQHGRCSMVNLLHLFVTTSLVIRSCIEARYLSKALHLLHNSHLGCFRVWDEEKQDVVVAADIKSLSILPDVDSLLQGQQHPRPSRPGDNVGLASHSP